MKKRITKYFLMVAILFSAMTASAQAEWKKSSPIGISYGTQTLKEDASGVEYKSNFSLGIYKRHTYNLLKNPIGDVLMFGLDANWFEMNVARYAKGKGLSLGSLTSGIAGNVTSGNYSSFEDYFKDAYQSAPSEDYDGDLSSVLKRLNVGKFQANIHILGIGPSVKWAPFGAGLNSTLNKIKLTAYFHYLPTVTALVFSGEGEDEDITVSAGYMSCWRGGLSLQFGRFGVGVERYWGSGNLKRFSFDDDDDDDDNGLDITSEKRKYHLSGLRFYVGLKF